MNIRHSIVSILHKAGTFTSNFVDILGASAQSSTDDQSDKIAPSGGVLNYRTGNLDDGTDAIGWYEDN